ncbi:spx/MgsR family transcriptional regulator [Sutterella faecalis]|uniref:Spx/MgsR family transcriptional regulator n=2 Tax=Sutterella TaxID=40544 RepID=A0AAI9SEE8_9BURK|nr:MULTISPECIES: ArsC/Spx/MgsR family protein [Sutterella]KAB7652048.1 spx/MgsR family transcriptional regulator [Sutterella seckii]MBE5692348.1 spx/MgsR family transcriptional regulator [Sutterella sp.]QDA54627.1 spx/MgsR family transcriptional regulator [Sutterella faecalis]
MIQIYGIPTCGSVKKAIAWAREAGVEFTFHNFRTEAPTDELLSGWLKDIPAAKLANTAGPTWRKIDPEIREAAKASPEMLKTLMLSTPLLIKRPVIVWADGSATSGVDEALWKTKSV